MTEPANGASLGAEGRSVPISPKKKVATSVVAVLILALLAAAWTAFVVPRNALHRRREKEVALATRALVALAERDRTSLATLLGRNFSDADVEALHTRVFGNVRVSSAMVRGATVMWNGGPNDDTSVVTVILPQDVGGGTAPAVMVRWDTESQEAAVVDVDRRPSK